MKKIKSVITIILLICIFMPILKVNASEEAYTESAAQSAADALFKSSAVNIVPLGEMFHELSNGSNDGYDPSISSDGGDGFKNGSTTTTYNVKNPDGTTETVTESARIHIDLTPDEGITSYLEAYGSLKQLLSGHMSFVGVLVTFMQYDNNLPEAEREKELGKYLFLTSSGALSGTSSNIKARESFGVNNKPDNYSGHDGILKPCGNNHVFPTKITDYDFTINYGAASAAPLFGTFPQLIDSFDFSLGGTTSSLKKAIFSDGSNGTPLGLLLSKFPDPPTLKVKFGLPNVDIEKYFDTYFWKIEPVYRYFPAPLKEREPGSDDITVGRSSLDPSMEESNQQMVKRYKTYAPSSAAGYDDTTDYESGLWGQGNLTSYKCGDIYNESWTIYSSTKPDENEECPNNYTLNEDKTKCVYSRTETADRECFITYHHYTYSASLNIPTNINTPRNSASAGNYSLLSSFYTTYFENTTKAKAIDSDGLAIPGEYDYIVGANYKMAIGGSPAESGSYHTFDPKYNKYLLVGNISGHNFSNWRNEIVGMGLSSLRFKTPKCKEICSKIENPDTVAHSSDAYLQCAQSFCESQSVLNYSDYATNEKRDCIVNLCGYKPKDPLDCSNLTGDSLNLVTKAVADNTAYSSNSDSHCGFTNVGSATKNTSDVSIGAYSSCKRYGGIDKVNENGVMVYAYSTGNIDNSYINVVCEESSNFDIPSLANKVIKPGTGYEYPIYLKGSRSCELFFDTVSWTYDFASTHSLDSVRKRMLLQKVEAFNKLNSSATKNNQINGSDLLGNSIYYDKNGKLVNLSDIEGVLPNLSSFDYSSDLNKTSVTATTDEYVNGLKYVDGYKIYNGGGPIVFDRTDFKKTSNFYLDNNYYMIRLNKYEIGATLDQDKEITTVDSILVNSYKIQSSLNASYELPKVCNDGKNDGTRLLANSSGQCDLGAYGIGDGLREYYTDFRYKNHSVYNRILSNSLVYKTDMDGNTNTSSSYLNVDDTCHYGYSPSVECEIIIEKDPDCYVSNDLVLENKNSVSAILKVKNNTTSKDSVVSQRIYAVKDGVVIADNIKKIDVPLYYLNTASVDYSEAVATVNNVKIYGEVVINDGTADKKYSCSKEFTPIKLSNNDSCTITKVTDDKYKINFSGIYNPSVYAGTSLQKDNFDNISMVKIEPDVDGNYYFTRITKENNEFLLARVEGPYGSATCQLKFTCTTGYCCTDLYEPSQIYEIKKYCDDNYAKDCQRYDKPNSCVEHCSMSDCEKDLTEEQRKKLDIVEGYCTSHYTVNSQISDCITLCYEDYSDIDPSFRPINLNNPFPYSKYVGASYNAGNRHVGKEWVAVHDTITEDAAQIQRGQKVEYKIHLTTSDIKAISADTKAYNESLPEGSIYQYTTNALDANSHSMCSSTGYTGYCSKFIYGSDFSSLFSYRKGVRNSG